MFSCSKEGLDFVILNIGQSLYCNYDKFLKVIRFLLNFDATRRDYFFHHVPIESLGYSNSLYDDSLGSLKRAVLLAKNGCLSILNSTYDL